MFNLFYRNTRLLILTLLLILVWGISSFQTLPRLEDPELVSRNAVVTTFFPGADAKRVEALVTKVIEDEVTEIEEVSSYESTSRAGVSLIPIELSESVTAAEVSGIWSRVRDKLDDAQLEFPAGVSDPELEATEVKAYSLVVSLQWNRDDAPNYAILGRLAASLKDRLDTLPGTESVDLFGAADEEIVVQVDSSQMASLGLTPQALSQQLAQTDAKAAAGQVRGERTNLPLEVGGELDSLERLARTPVQFDDQGRVVLLGDIAQIEKGTREPLQELALVGGKPAVALGVFVKSNYRLDQWSQQAQPILDDFRSQLSSGIRLSVLFDQTRYVTTRLNNLILNLLLAAMLVFGVTLVMMGWQSAVVVGIALPLSLLLVFGMMRLLGIPLHQISITGLIVALGVLIDTAIVMVDEVYRHLRHGVSGAVAINRSIQHLAVPLLSSTVTTVLTFMPIALLPGNVGEFVGTIGINMILAVSVSFLLSITVIPALAVHIFHWRGSHYREETVAQLSWWQVGISLPNLNFPYQRLLAQTIRRPVWGIFLALLLPAMGFMLAPTLEQQFFPASDRDQLQIQMELLPSAAIQETEAVAQAVRELLLQNEEVKEVHWLVGTNAPRFYYNLIGGRENEPNYAQALVQLNQLSSVEITHTLQTEIDAAFPNGRIVVRQLEQGPPFDAPIEVRILGSDLTQLQRLGEAVRSRLIALDAVTHTRASLNETLPQAQFALNEAAVRLAGLDNREIAQRLDQTLEGIQGGSILEDTEELPVRVRMGNRASLDAIASLPLIGNSTEEWLPLDALGSLTLTPEISAITHFNGERVNTIQGFVRAGVLPATVLSQFQQALQTDDIVLPLGYRLSFGGEAEERTKAIDNLVSTIGVLVVLTVATLVLSLGSFQLAGLIGGVAFFSFGLGLFSVAVFGYPFGFNPIIGTVGLIGVAINDSIVVLVALEKHPEAHLGDPVAIQSVVSRSTRHVLTTTFTTMIGFVPLLLNGGDFWPPLAVAIAGGVGGSTFLALFFIPSTYRLLYRSAKGKATSNREIRQTVGPTIDSL
ncbi:efflux RND transporter permease subunit [Leptolyngbyaceae cyanobacterium CCMR0082]|uniref:Efflux RND transporter permease subunit n=1 Tax=Adonisia turfae CCMR0082 TaxID=2304604 RepID=A0A6M0S6L4_9CYAN|nr:efflux RND transporter permease subunit [Adonisia turfae]NEZ63621.1 efflux RND transporter permease subunit [Adonisia turfae CCMR0082]